MNLTQILEATVSPDQNELQQAQTYLEQAAQENLPQFIVALVNELADGGKSQVARMAAGLQLKNALTSKDPTIRMQHQQRWLTLDEQVKQHVKQMVIQTLGTEKARPAIAPQCIAAIACAEIPNRQWLEVTDLLQTMVVTAGNTDALKEQALESIGYICQDIEPEHLVEQSHKILTAIVSGMRKEEPNIQIRLAATNALLNSLEFSKQNFERELKVAALQNLVKIMSLYYQHMEEYMGRALFPISISAIKSDCDEVSLQGIEFWSSVCDEEMDLAIEAAEAAESNRKPEQTSRFYAKGALQYLTPLLTDSLKRQEDFDDEDDWNPCKAAGVCLMLLAQCCENDVLQYVIDFITANIEREDWKSRDAAVMAFAPVSEEEEEPQTYCLSVWFSKIVQKLLAVTDRPDANQGNLRSAAYEALMELIKNSAKDCYEFVQETTLVILHRLQHVLQMEKNVSDRAQYNDLQSLLCATLQSVLRKVNSQDALQIANPIMTALLQMLNAGTGVVGGVQEDALMAIGTLVCIAAVGLVGDIARALGSNILSHSDLFMQILLENLADGNVHRSVKPQILSVFGDIALAIGVNFKNYFEVVIATLNQASITNVDKGDYDMVDYLNDLREGCLEAYTGIIQGLKGDSPEGTIFALHLVLKCILCWRSKPLMSCYRKEGDRRHTKPNRSLPGQLKKCASSNNNRDAFQILVLKEIRQEKCQVEN
ncbi:Importin subunit beta-1 [Acropora cervicornis]|uniref:Importin subunit beta-1 n=1 Tax=Acropora cervicornis TaxID=6130 RepID=A0AAD9URZ9_ACRCE|nr:Importin subunit beta-1 [Acropora cervicornis]